MEEKWKELKKVFHEYLGVISKNHHKTKDGQLTIQRNYYGWEEEDHGWEIIHGGYVNEFSVKGLDEIDAINTAIRKFKGLIAEEKEYQKQYGEF